MGSITPVLAGLGNINAALGAANALTGSISNLGNTPVRNAQREQELALKQLQQKQALNAKNLAQQTALEKERIAADAAAAENSRLAALRRAVARQRANFGAQGTGADGGSAGAVLLGLFDESAEELAQREKIDDLRRRSLDLGAAQRGALNTLQYSQLQERQKLGRLAAEGERYGGFLPYASDLFDGATQLADRF